MPPDGVKLRMRESRRGDNQREEEEEEEEDGGVATYSVLREKLERMLSRFWESSVTDTVIPSLSSVLQHNYTKTFSSSC